MAREIEIRVPDIGDFEDVEIVEVLVAAGDQVGVEDPLVSIESDKATMEVPSPDAGVVRSVEVALGDKVSEGTLLVVLEVEEAGRATGEARAPTPAPKPSQPAAEVAPPAAPPPPSQAAAPEQPEPVEPRAPAPSDAPPAPAPARRPPVDAVPPPDKPVHASPGVRKAARELGVDLAEARGSGGHGRVLEDDLKAFVRDRMKQAAQPGAAPVPAPAADFSKFGPVQEKPLGRIRRVAAKRLARSWPAVPQVTQHDEADISAIEAWRADRADTLREQGVRLSPLIFALKACVLALRRFPDVRASLAPEGDRLIIKDYFHIGVAVDTEEGLIVPVVRDVERKGLRELSEEVGALAERARSRKLAPTQLQGAVFTISSLGGIGGTSFTPLVNAPEVAILGLSRTQRKPVWDEDTGSFLPRHVLPLSLSYDHRVIDGAVAVRFTQELARVLSDPSNLLL